MSEFICSFFFHGYQPWKWESEWERDRRPGACSMEILLHWEGCLTQPSAPTNTHTQNDLIHHLRNHFVHRVNYRKQKWIQRPVKNLYSFELDVGTQVLSRTSSALFWIPETFHNFQSYCGHCKQGIIVLVRWRKEMLGEEKWIGLDIGLSGSGEEDRATEISPQTSWEVGKSFPFPPLGNVDFKLLKDVLKTKRY